MSRRVFDADALVADYLAELQQRLEPLRWTQRSELLEEVAHHIDEERARLPDQHVATVRALLERLGDPADIAAEAGAPEADTVAGQTAWPPAPASTPGRQEVWAIWLLLLGGFLCLVGWIVGLALLWQSRVWRLRDKVVGTLLLPGGLAGPVLYLFRLWSLHAVSRGTVHHVAPTLATIPTSATTAAATVGLTASDQGVLVTSPGNWILAMLINIAVVVLLLIPIATAAYLAWRRRTALRA